MTSNLSSVEHQDGDPEDFIGEELPDPWEQPGLWSDPTPAAPAGQDLSALLPDPKTVSS